MLESGKNVDVIYLDFAKTFDMVDFAVVIEKAKKLGVRGKMFNWIRSFLTNRSQTAIVNGAKSQMKEVVSRISQSSDPCHSSS